MVYVHVVGAVFEEAWGVVGDGSSAHGVVVEVGELSDGAREGANCFAGWSDVAE